MASARLRVRLIRPAAVPCLVALVASLAACGGQRVKECNALIGVINGEQEGAKAPTGQDPKELVEVANRLDEVAKRVAAVPIAIERLKNFQNEYQSLVSDLGAAMRDAAAALREQDRKKLDAVRVRETELGDKEGTLVTAINQFCTGS